MRLGLFDRRPRPIESWRAQPIEQRRLQTMLAVGLALVTSMLLAIALRGEFVTLFLVMIGCSAIYLSVAAYIGSQQLHHQEAQNRARREASRAIASRGRPADRAQSSGRSATEQGYSGSLGDGRLFDDAFFEPIPELIFEPLNLEHEAELVDEAVAGGSVDSALDTGTPGVGGEDDINVSVPFKTPRRQPSSGLRSGQKAPPIYIEPDDDADDGRAPAVNDR